MALVRGFTPNQFRGRIMGVIGPIPVSGTVPATAAGAVGTVAATMPANPAGGTYTAAQLGLLPTDLLFLVCTSAAGQLAGIEYSVTITSAGVLNIVQSNGTGGAVTSQALNFVVVGFRFDQA